MSSCNQLKSCVLLSISIIQHYLMRFRLEILEFQQRLIKILLLPFFRMAVHRQSLRNFCLRLSKTNKRVVLRPLLTLVIKETCQAYLKFFSFELLVRSI